MTKSHDEPLENVQPSVRKAARAEAVEIIGRMRWSARCGIMWKPWAESWNFTRAFPAGRMWRSGHLIEFRPPPGI